MKRRPLVVVPVVATLAGVASRGARAQALAERRARVGSLSRLPSTAAEGTRYWTPFFDELERRGWVRGRNLEWVERATMGRGNEQALAQELVAAKVDLIVAAGGPLTQAAMKATPSVPIVAVSVIYPVQTGLVASLARPGGNVTGVATLTSELAAKNFEMLRQLVPQARRVGVIWNPSSATARMAFDEQRDAAARLGLELVSLPISGVHDIDAALASALRERVRALAVHPNPAWWQRLPAAWGIEHQVAIISPPEQGYLFEVGPDWDEVMRIAAAQIDRVLRGADPAVLPMQQPTRFSFTLNLRIARALGLQVPAAVRLQATELIE